MTTKERQLLKDKTILDFSRILEEIVERKPKIPILFSFYSSNGYYYNEYFRYFSIKRLSFDSDELLLSVTNSAMSNLETEGSLALDFLIDLDYLEINENTKISLSNYTDFFINLEELDFSEEKLILFFSLVPKKEVL